MHGVEHKAMIITFESGECGGKDTQIELLKERLLKLNPNYRILSGLYESGATPKAEILRMIIKNKHDTKFAFPGGFLNTFDLNKYRNFFAADKLPPLAKECLVKALMSMKEGVKYDAVLFLLNDSFGENSFLEKTIMELNRQDSSVIKSPDGEKAVSPADRLLSEYFSKDVLRTEEQLYLHLASRNLLYHNIVVPALENYDFIILNRSADSSTIYQGYAQPLLVKNKLERIRALNMEATEGHMPDITILLDITIKEVFRRKALRDKQERYAGITKDFFDEKEGSFHEKIRQGYLAEAEYYTSLPESDPEHGRIKVINAMGDPEDYEKSIQMVHELVWDAIYSKIKKELK
jgi:dTMP kinase